MSRLGMRELKLGKKMEGNICMNSDELKYLNLTGLYSRHQHKLKETSRIESTEADCLSIPQNSCWQGPLGPSAPAPAPAGTHRAGCPGPRPGSSGRSPRRRPHSLWAACASAPSLHSTEGLLVFRGNLLCSSLCPWPLILAVGTNKPLSWTWTIWYRFRLSRSIPWTSKRCFLLAVQSWETPIKACRSIQKITV